MVRYDSRASSKRSWIACGLSQLRAVSIPVHLRESERPQRGFAPATASNASAIVVPVAGQRRRACSSAARASSAVCKTASEGQSA